MTSRRDFLRGLMGASAFYALGCSDYGYDFDPTGADFSNARYLESLPLRELGTFSELLDDSTPNVKHWKGHNTRQFMDLNSLMPADTLDLSQITTEQLVNPVAHHYIRTEAPDQLHVATDADIPSFSELDDPKSRYLEPLREAWRVRVDGRVSNVIDLRVQEIAAQTSLLGATMMECAGNDVYSNFGLMSSSIWRGIRFMDFIEALRNSEGIGRTTVLSQATHVRISGFDDSDETRWNRLVGVESTPGASWIFSLEELKERGAFIATEMNGAALTLDHGFPVRLVVPGYYGCTSIKWLNHISFIEVDDNTETTAQMREFSDRTFQDGVPTKLKDHNDPIIDSSMIPVTVEKWAVDGEILYRCLGLRWGGKENDPEMRLLFEGRKTLALAVHGAPSSNTDAFSLWWSDFFKAPRTGRYCLKPDFVDEGIRARRLRDGYYYRGVKIREV